MLSTSKFKLRFNNAGRHFSKFSALCAHFTEPEMENTKISRIFFCYYCKISMGIADRKHRIITVRKITVGHWRLVWLWIYTLNITKTQIKFNNSFSQNDLQMSCIGITADCSLLPRFLEEYFWKNRWKNWFSKSVCLPEVVWHINKRLRQVNILGVQILTLVFWFNLISHNIIFSLFKLY